MLKPTFKTKNPWEIQINGDSKQRIRDRKQAKIYSVTQLDLGIFCDPMGVTATFLERMKLLTHVDQKSFDNNKLKTNIYQLFLAFAEFLAQSTAPTKSELPGLPIGPC